MLIEDDLVCPPAPVWTGETDEAVYVVLQQAWQLERQVYQSKIEIRGYLENLNRVRDAVEVLDRRIVRLKAAAEMIGRE